MHPLYDNFCKLCEELATKNRIEQILYKLYLKHDNLLSALNESDAILQKEQKDVKRLEKASVSSIFYTVIGQKNKKLEKEKAEASDAEKKYFELQSELTNLKEEIRQYERELRTVRGCDLRYGRILPQILDEIRTIDSPESKSTLDTFDTLTRIEKRSAILKKPLNYATKL